MFSYSKSQNLSWGFDLEEHFINVFKFTAQENPTNRLKDFMFEVNPVTGFEDWAPIEVVSYSDSEVFQFQIVQQENASYFVNPPIETERDDRIGCPEEFSDRTAISYEEDIDSWNYLTESTLNHFRAQESFVHKNLLKKNSFLKEFNTYQPISENSNEYLLEYSPLEGVSKDFYMDLKHSS